MYSASSHENDRKSMNMRLLVYLWASALRSESASIHCNHITLILTVLLRWHCLPRALAAPMCGQSLDPPSRSSADDNHWRQLIESRKFHYWGLPPRERRSDWNQADASQLAVTVDVATGTVIALAVVSSPWDLHTRASPMGLAIGTSPVLFGYFDFCTL